MAFSLRSLLIFTALIAAFSVPASAGIIDDGLEAVSSGTQDACELPGFAQFYLSSCLTYNFATGLITDSGTDTLHNSVDQQATYIADGRDDMAKSLQEQVNLSYGIGTGAAKTSIVQSLNNGYSEAEAGNNATREINRFWSELQLKMYKYHKKQVVKANGTLSTLEEASNIDPENVFNADFSTGFDSWNVKRQNVTLFNGTTIQSYGLEMSGCCSSSSQYTETISPASLENYGDGQVLTAVDVNGNETVDVLGTGKIQDSYSSLKDARQRALDNVNTMTSEIYSNYDTGEISLSEVMGPLEAIKTAGTNYESTGYYGYASQSLEMAGIATNETFAYRLRYDNAGVEEKEAWGQLFVDSENLTTLKVNETYDASGKKVTFVHETENGKAVETDLNGTFTVLELKNTDTGESINETTLQEVGFYADADVSELEKQVQRIIENQKDIQASGLGGLDVGGQLDNLTPDWMPTWAAGGLIVLFAFMGLGLGGGLIS